MSLKDDNLRFVVLHAMGDAIKKELGRLRSEHTDVLVEQYKDTKGTAYKVTLPGDSTPVATVTLRVPQSELEVDLEDAALIKWAADNHADVVELETIPAQPEKIIPAVPEHEVPFINLKKWTEIAKHFERGDNDEVIDTTTGLVVEGAKWSTPPDPSQFEVRYSTGGRDRLGTAYQTGKLNDVIAGSTLAPLTAGPVVERRLVAVPVEVTPGDLGPSQPDAASVIMQEQSDPWAAPKVSPAQAALDDYVDEIDKRYAAVAAVPEVNLAEGSEDAPEFDPGSW